MRAALPPRLTDWRSRLTRYFTEVARRPLAYGQHDCALFAAGAVEAMTGVDLAAEFRGRYTTVVEGLDLLAAKGAADGLEGEIDHVSVLPLLFQPVVAAFAQVGDIAVVPVPGSNLPALGILEGQHIAVLRPDGMGFVPRENALATFRVAE